MCSEKSGSHRPLFLTLERSIIPTLIEVVRRSRRLSRLGLWLAGNRPLLLAVVVSAAQETDLGRDHLDGGTRVAVFVFVLTDLEAAFDIHAILCAAEIYAEQTAQSATDSAQMMSLLTIIRPAIRTE